MTRLDLRWRDEGGLLEPPYLEHGDVRGYLAHLHAGTRPCVRCRRAWLRFQIVSSGAGYHNSTKERAND